MSEKPLVRREWVGCWPDPDEPTIEENEDDIEVGRFWPKAEWEAIQALLGAAVAYDELEMTDWDTAISGLIDAARAYAKYTLTGNPESGLARNGEG